MASFGRIRKTDIKIVEKWGNSITVRAVIDPPWGGGTKEIISLEGVQIFYLKYLYREKMGAVG